MTYYSAFMLAGVLFAFVVLWSVVEITLQNRKEKQVE